MNPQDALPQDYPMYYNGCWMEHVDLGIGRVMVTGSRLYLDTDYGLSEATLVKAKDLICWWPRPGAFNGVRDAMYIARRAQRNMRKSAMPNDHYYLKWGNPYGGSDMMQLLKEGANHIPIEDALEAFAKKKRTSAAVSRDIIIHPTDTDPKVCSVIFRGNEVGTLENGYFTPLFSSNPIDMRALRQLEGIQCTL